MSRDLPGSVGRDSRDEGGGPPGCARRRHCGATTRRRSGPRRCAAPWSCGVPQACGLTARRAGRRPCPTPGPSRNRDRANQPRGNDGSREYAGDTESPPAMAPTAHADPSPKRPLPGTPSWQATTGTSTRVGKADRRDSSLVSPHLLATPSTRPGRTPAGLPPRPLTLDRAPEQGVDLVIRSRESPHETLPTRLGSENISASARHPA